MINCYDEPDTVHIVLEKATEFLISYAKAYKAVGADGVFVAEPVAGLLSPALEEEFSSPYIKRIIDAVQDDSFGFIYHNCGDNAHRMLDSILSTGCMAYHFGNSIDMERDILKAVGEDVIVMGNVDPAGILRMGTVESVTETTNELIEKCSSHPNFVLSSGCDIPPMTPWNNIDAFFECAKKTYG
jgi:uroporphyrinogen decarboxylase